MSEGKRDTKNKDKDKDVEKDIEKDVDKDTVQRHEPRHVRDESGEPAALHGAIEALLFVSDEPVSAAVLSKVLEKTPSQVDEALTTLAQRFEDEDRGIQLREIAGGWRFYSHPAFHELIEQYVLSWDTRSLSQAALEALAVVAYHQPATRAAVNSVRGVNSEGVISSLIDKGLVREMGRDSGPGNAILYGTTHTFLEKFGLKTLKELPPLEDFAPDEESKAFIRERLSAHAPALEEFDEDDNERDVSLEQAELDEQAELEEQDEQNEQNEDDNERDVSLEQVELAEPDELDEQDETDDVSDAPSEVSRS
jgi:segregation and condensation protein B